MSLAPLPRYGDVFTGRDAAGRTLRISAHPERGRLVLSIWQDEVCRATVRVAREDVPMLVDALVAAAADLDVASAPASPRPVG